MPTYCHVCKDENCKYEWEEEYSIKDDPPKICPKCKQETAKRVIAAAVGGTVELYGQELVSKLREDGAKMRKEVYANEYKYADIIGSDKYQAITKQMENNKKNRST